MPPSRLVLLGCLALLVGCASTASRQGIYATTQPGSLDTQQISGQIVAGVQAKLANQIEAVVEATGVEYTTAVPIGQVILLALMLTFSHLREVRRIKQNGTKLD